MALINVKSSSLCSVNNFPDRKRIPHRKTVPKGFGKDINIIVAKDFEKNVVRRSANYHPSNWDLDFVESLSSTYVGEEYDTRQKELKGEVKKMLKREKNHLGKLEMIDALQRLGISYHFEAEFEEILSRIYYDNLLKNTMKINVKEDICTTALQFRLLRQQGFNVPQEVFNSYKDENGNFNCEDVKGLVQMYEASFLSIGGETLLDELREFAAKNLRSYANKGINCDNYVSKLVNHALEFPLHWRMQRAEARWFIEACEINSYLNPILLQFAKLDFNMVQAIYQQDLKDAIRWWKKTGFGEKLEFVRDRPMEGFLWTIGGLSEPEFGYERRMLARVGALITIIDDIYDVYATLDEAQLFTDAVHRWDVNAMDELPDYMKMCFLCLHNTVNEMGFDCLKQRGLNVIPYLKKAWGDLCKTYLLEAKWYHNGYTPSVKEYLENGSISISGPLLLVHAYFAATNQITNEATESLKCSYPDVVHLSSLITRLADDLGTSPHEIKRGDNPKSIQCYMNETGESEEIAQDYVRELIKEAWEKMNRTQMENTMFSKTFMRMGMNLARMSQCIYQYGDGFGALNTETTDHILSLLVKPLQL